MLEDKRVEKWAVTYEHKYCCHLNSFVSFPVDFSLAMMILKVLAFALFLSACAAMHAADEECRVDRHSSTCARTERHSVLNKACLVTGISGVTILTHLH